MSRFVTALAALLFATAGEASADKVRAYVLYGQGGTVTSLGMVKLAAKLKSLDTRITVTKHGWNFGRMVADVAASIRRLPASTRIVIAGYSLGAGGATWIATAVPERRIDLIAAYDPSVFQTFPAAPPNVKRVLLYHNRCAPIWGRAVIIGPQVETTEVCSMHLAVDFNARLHARTLDAVKRVLGSLVDPRCDGPARYAAMREGSPYAHGHTCSDPGELR